MKVSLFFDFLYRPQRALSGLFALKAVIRYTSLIHRCSDVSCIKNLPWLLSFAVSNVTEGQATSTVEDENSERIQKELDHFLSVPAADSLTDPLEWWKQHQNDFPRLASFPKVARKLLSVQPTSAPSERVFSIAGTIFQKNRMRLKPENADKILFLNLNDSFLSE